jgi:hypothetical protein
MKRIVMSIGLLGAATAAVAAARDVPPMAGAKAFDQLLACKGITDSAQRLACYDQTVGTLADAKAKRDIVVVDKQEVREAKRSLFGFTLPNLRIFGDSDAAKGSEEPEEKEITATVRGAREDGAGNWIVTLDDGAVWHQTDGEIAIAPKPGTQVTIRRAALGSYFLRVGKQPGVKARREN